MPSVALSALLPTATVIVLSASKVPPAVSASTVTVVAPPFSATLDGVAVSVIVPSSLSVSVTFAMSAGFEPGMETSSVSLPSTSVSSVGVRVNVPVTLVLPAASLNSKSSTLVKSVPEVAVPLLTLNGISTDSATDTPPVVTVTVTVVAPAPSETVDGETVRVGLCLSLSSTAPPAGVTVVPVELPLAVTVSSRSRMLSRLAVVLNVAVPLVSSALMMMVKSLTAV